MVDCHKAKNELRQRRPEPAARSASEFASLATHRTFGKNFLGNQWVSKN